MLQVDFSNILHSLHCTIVRFGLAWLLVVSDEQKNWKMFFSPTAGSLSTSVCVGGGGFQVTWLVEGSVSVLPSAIA